MNISKNLLSLGLIAVISGVSTAQTYTATAGTNGTTDIQADYSMSTGDGASVSVDVPLEFELPKKVAIAVAPNGTDTLPANSMFDGISLYTQSSGSKILNLTPYNSTSWSNVSANRVEAYGGIYSNTAIVIEMSSTSYIHEADPNSIIEGNKGFAIGKKDSSSYTNSYIYYFNRGVNDPTTALTHHTLSIDDTTLADNDNKLTFWVWDHIYLDTVNATDRAGKYLSTKTITVSTL